ncbi:MULTISPECIES: alpha-hydroxy-acid oxidizing protein [unclassified Variovorax]|uniref:alpha-hydroxy-acid oxidizing protein n=1 Tax=unclassified Variovorax TaxID=663243 RepID=UPI003F4621CB
MTVFGRPYAAPFGIGPMGMLSMLRHDADLLLAEVAGDAGVSFVLSGASNAPIEDVAIRAPGSWLQFYPCRDSEIERDLLKRAVCAGIETLVVTVDARHVPVVADRTAARSGRATW